MLSLEDFENIKGVMVMKYSEKNAKELRKQYKDKGVEVLFYEHGLQYLKV
jgi:superfamily II helicase